MIILRQRLFSTIREIVDNITDLGDIKLVKSDLGRIAKFLRNFKYFRDKQNRMLLYDVVLKSTGEIIGSIQIHEDIPGIELNVVDLIISNKHRGLGYATKVMKAIINIAREKKYKKLTLEVPGKSPDAKHIYEKLGFKETGEVLGDENDLWGGLTCMELKL